MFEMTNSGKLGCGRFDENKLSREKKAGSNEPA